MNKKNLSINIDLEKIKKHNRKTQWYKAVYYSLVISVVVFGSLCVYLFYRPASQEVVEIINNEISSTSVKFDEKTLEMVKNRQNPKETIDSSTGKNPFSPF